MFDKTGVRRVQRLLDELRVVESDLPISYAVAFVAAYSLGEELGHMPNVQGVCHATGLTRPTMSRILLSLGDRRQANRRLGSAPPEGARKSLGLLERHQDDEDLRMVRYSLTPKGMGLMRRLVSHVTD